MAIRGHHGVLDFRAHLNRARRLVEGGFEEGDHRREGFPGQALDGHVNGLTQLEPGQLPLIDVEPKPEP